MFELIGRIAFPFRRWIVAAWTIVLVAGIALVGLVLPRLTADPSGGTSLEAVRVAERLYDLADHGPSLVAVVEGFETGVAPGESPVAREIVAARDDLVTMVGVDAVLEPVTSGDPNMVATDGRAGLVVVQLAKDHRARHAGMEAVAERLRAIDAPGVMIGGGPLVDAELERAIERDLASERVALPIAFIVLVVILGGLIAAGLPMLLAFAAVGGSMFVLMAATGLMDVSVYALNVVVMFGLGLGIDYGLLMVSRFREERARGADVAAAVQRTVATAGRTVAFSAMTVAAAMAGLFVFDDPTLRSFGVAGMGVVGVSMVAAITLLPALLSVFGRRIRPLRPRRRDGTRFHDLARWVQRHAVITTVVVGVGLAALAAPFATARFENSDARWLPRSSEVRSVAMTLTERFPASGADPIFVVADVDPHAAAAVGFLDEVRQMDGVAAAGYWHGYDHHVQTGDDAVTVFSVIPAGTSQGETAQALVEQLRDADAGFDVEVGGTAPSLVDTRGSIGERLPVAFAVIALATFVLLFLMTGSVIVPIKAIVLNVLSLGASFGALVWGFQDGHLAGILGFDPVGSLDLFMPVLVFIFAFGLSMDYEVFLLGRVKEIYDETGDNDHAVATGLQRTGGIITSAALLIVVVFAGFAMGEVLGIKMLGFGLALAVVVDAAIVRTLLVPAAMKLMGDRNWWAPDPLRRLHARFGLREGSADAIPAIPTLGADPVPAVPVDGADLGACTCAVDCAGCTCGSSAISTSPTPATV